MMAMNRPRGRAFQQFRFQRVADGDRLLDQIVDSRQIACAQFDDRISNATGNGAGISRT
jgi:hypothetical protein